MAIEESERSPDWTAIAFMAATPIAAAVLAPLHLYSVGLGVGLVAFTLGYSVLTSLSITAGYHRLFSHRSYRASAGLRFAYLLLATATFQNSALEWALRHRRHHRYEDTERDPYNIRQGFLYAHIGWIGIRYPVEFEEFPADLRGDRLVVWQHRYYLPLAIGMGFGVPVLAGLALGSWWGGLVWAGLVRIVFQHHCTFLVNSWAHTFGRRPYQRQTSARDSNLLALITYGEGYHNFHHAFPNDYRTGIRWYHWDPTKWAIRALAFAHAARDLRCAPREVYLRARAETAEAAEAA